MLLRDGQRPSSEPPRRRRGADGWFVFAIGMTALAAILAVVALLPR